MGRGQNLENASIAEINAAIDVTATKIRDLRSNKKNMAEIAVEVKHLVTLRRLLKEKSEKGMTAEDAPSNAEATLTSEATEQKEAEKKVEAAPAAASPEALSPVAKTEEKPKAVQSPNAQGNDEASKKVAELESLLAKSEEKLALETNKSTSLQNELNRQVQKYDIEITTSNNMQQRLQNDMKKLVQDKLELERSLKAAKESHAEALAASEAALAATQAELEKESQSFFLLKAAEAESQKLVDNLKTQLAEANAKLQSLESELETLRNERREQDALLQQAQRDLERERVRFEMELDAEKKLQARAHQDARRYSLERQNSVDQLKASMSEVEKLQSNLNEAVEARRTLEDTVVRLEAERETSQNLLKTLAKDCKDQKSELEKLKEAEAFWAKEREELLSHVEAHDETKDKLNELQAHNDSLQASIEEATTAASTLEDNIAKLHATQAKLAAEKEELLHHVSQSEQDKAHLARIQVENEELQRSINDMTSVSDTLHAKLNSYKLELSKLAGEKEALLHHAAANESHEAAIAQLTLENTQLRASLTEKTASATAMAKSVQVAESKLLDTQYMMTNEMLKVSSLEKALAKAQQALTEATTQHKAALDAKSSEAKNALSELQAVQAQLAQLQKSTEKAGANKSSKDDELKSAKSTIVSLRAQVSEARDAAANAESTLKSVQAELKVAGKSDKDEAARLRKENGKLADVISQLRKEITTAQSTTSSLKSLETERLALRALLIGLFLAFIVSKFL